MKDLLKFDSVKKALDAVVAENDVDNGTSGIEFLAHFWEQENIWDGKRHELQTAVAAAWITGDLRLIKEKQTELEKLEKPKIIMAWKLIEPIPNIMGTKILRKDGKSFRLSMKKVDIVYISEDAIKLGLLEYEETNELGQDSQLRDAKIIKIHLKKGIIDVAAPIVDRNGKELRPKRAYVTPISYRSMQVAGEVINRQANEERRRYGYEEVQ